jgi:hypothetical protein
MFVANNDVDAIVRLWIKKMPFLKLLVLDEVLSVRDLVLVDALRAQWPALFPDGTFLPSWVEMTGQNDHTFLDALADAESQRQVVSTLTCVRTGDGPYLSMPFLEAFFQRFGKQLTCPTVDIESALDGLSAECVAAILKNPHLKTLALEVSMEPLMPATIQHILAHPCLLEITLSDYAANVSVDFLDAMSAVDFHALFHHPSLHAFRFVARPVRHISTKEWLHILHAPTIRNYRIRIPRAVADELRTYRTKTSDFAIDDCKYQHNSFLRESLSLWNDENDSD